MAFIVKVDEPPDGSWASVLDYRDDDDYYWYLICCHGYAQGLDDKDVLKRVWAKVYTEPLPPDSPYLTSGQPDNSDPDTLHSGDIDPMNKTAFFFKGSQHGGHGLITLADAPSGHITQYLYVWAQRQSDNGYATPAEVTMSVKVKHRTHCGDDAP